jgi:hypothetical protein
MDCPISFPGSNIRYVLSLSYEVTLTCKYYNNLACLNLRGQKDLSMSVELRQVANGLPIGSGNILGMTSMDIVFAQQATTKVDPIEKPCILESLRLGLTRSSILDELKKYMNSIFMVPNRLLQ